ncbi:amidase [Hyphococcus luteus]|uniref:Amidase domain-containing protein n=1 Tax=Hyphococcus luteus TaxID=2058213 RepID=A0A2S7K4L9_9PROT|nr:amidase [Marinicaulis flavus]PQA87442.1 hypothetical protein CW354_11595 [Marinicaulis flavus]
MSLTRRNLMQSGGYAAMLLTAAGACSRPDQAASNDLAELDGVETAARLKSGELGPTEAVEAAIARAERVDPQINAIVTKTFRRARKEAAAKGANAGLWAGVPTFVKDLDDVTGVTTRFGSRAFPFYKGKEQTPLIDAFLGMGVVSLGKSATPEFGLSATTESIATGQTRNPWNTEHSTGGSSGGAAALVASGVVPIAHASDGGGSIRIPASCCGNVGLKVSRGRNPMARPEDAVGPISLAVHGVQTRTVRDTAAVAATLALPSSESGLAPLPLVTAPGKERLRIAVTTQGLAGRAPDPAVKQAAEDAAALCADLGHHVEEASLPVDDGLSEDFTLYWAAFAHATVAMWEKTFHLPRNGLAFEPFTIGLADRFEREEADFPGAIERLQAVAARMAAFHETYDLVLSPVVTAPPPEIGYLGATLDYETLMQRLTDYVQYTVLYNVTGAPAISLPLSMSPDGLPVGAMFGAPLGREDRLLALAYELEEAKPWAGRRPAVWG